MKPVRWQGDANDRLRDFPEDARGELGFHLYLVQVGQEPDSWKPMGTVGGGVTATPRTHGAQSNDEYAVARPAVQAARTVE